MMVYLMCALSCVAAYLLCGFPTGLIVGERLGHVDVRKVGSGNVGTTNVARSVGKLGAALTLLGDVAKAALSVGVGWLLLGVASGAGVSAVAPGGAFDWTLALVYLCAILGHVFSPYLRFRGGKGIAVGFGGALALMWPVGLSLLAPFVLFAVLTRYVSAGSIAAALSLPLLAWLWERPSATFVVIMCVVTALVVWSHRANIARLARGEERRFSFKKR